MAFLNPLFLIGLFAAAVPLLIHLWSRRQAVSVDFSSLMFLVAAHRQNVRRFQIKQLLILLLRMLIIALIALALARPFLTLGLPLAAVRAKTDVVIVLDNSYSMGYKDVDGIWFDKAKTLATDVLRSLRHGDSASLILMSDIPQLIFQKLTSDVESVIVAIENAELSYRSTNIQQSVEAAHEMLSESQQKNKELYLISDFTLNGWNNFEIIPNHSGARIVLIPVRGRDAHNTNIEEIIPSHQLIGIDLPFHFNIANNNHSNTPLEQTTLTLYIGDQKQKNQTFSADANESLMTTFTHTFSTPGTHFGHFELTEDRLNTDNIRYFALEALGEIRVLCVSEKTEYLKLALNPTVTEQTEKTSITNAMIQPTACTPTEFETFPLEEFDLILFAEIKNITTEAETQIREFIRQGKSIIAFISTKANLSWAPAQFGEMLNWQIPQQVSNYDQTHPIFEIFLQNAFSGDYGPKFYEGLAVTPKPDSNIIARFEDETPFLIEQREGNSHILFFNCGFQEESGNNELLVNPYFLPLLQHTVLYVMQSDFRKNLNIGETYINRFPQNPGGRAWIKQLDSDEADAEIAVSIEDDGTIRFENTEKPGVYQVDIKLQNSLFRDFFAVNTDVDEADLTSISIQHASERVHAQTGFTSKEGELDTQELDIKRHGREIWGELLILATCLLLLEGVLSNRHSATSAGEI